MPASTLSRRSFLAAAPALLTAARMLGDVPATEFRLRYLLASCMYGTLPLSEILPEVAKVGAEGIDLWPKVHGNQREQADALGREAFSELLAEHHVQLAMTTRYDLGPFQLRDEIEFVHHFGGSLIVTGSAKPPQGDLKAAVREFVRQMEDHVAVAERQGVTIAIENHANALIDSPDSLRYFAEFAKSPHLGIAFAPYHLPQNPVELGRLIEDLGPRLVHFYAWEHGQGCHEKLPKADEMRQLPGYGTLDFGPVLQALRKIRYGGKVEVFMHPVPRGIPVLPTAGEVSDAINRSRAALERSLPA